MICSPKWDILTVQIVDAQTYRNPRNPFLFKRPFLFSLKAAVGGKIPSPSFQRYLPQIQTSPTTHLSLPASTKPPADALALILC
ncbi:hypothetical protein MRB53_024701 [Persea americana]|uniref:Uncharacterized protein n=1 Tax=Persea americana TaxID=3435 RepID=A0ACC2LE66_PERAE|nr:hypothetical protein MRB53_024701 [Persea americana]